MNSAEVYDAAVLPHAVEADGVLDFEPWRSETFYDETPFDFSVDDVEWRASPGLENLLEEFEGEKILEVGCGGGRNLSALHRRASELFVVDQSLRSLGDVRKKYSLSDGNMARASALALPHRDEQFDLVVLDGVAHHTGDAERAVAEAARVLKVGGRAYLALYRAGALYENLYRFVGGPLRAARAQKNTAIDSMAFGIYRAASRLIKPGRTGNEHALRNIYEDYFLTPIATFHSEEDLRALFSAVHLQIDDLKPYKNVWSVVATKMGPVTAEE